MMVLGIAPRHRTRTVPYVLTAGVELRSGGQARVGESKGNSTTEKVRIVLEIYYRFGVAPAVSTIIYGGFCVRNPFCT